MKLWGSNMKFNDYLEKTYTAAEKKEIDKKFEQGLMNMLNIMSTTDPDEIAQATEVLEKPVRKLADSLSAALKKNIKSK